MRKLLRTGVVVLVLLVLVFLLLFRSRSTPSAPNTGFAGKSLPGVQQVVLVEGANEGGSRATVSVFEIGADGEWKRVRGPYDARIGREGFKQPAQRRERDGTTPIGVFPLPSAFGADPAPGGTRLPYVQITQGSQCWISVPGDPSYNRWVVRDPCEPPNVNLLDKSRKGQIFHTAIVIGFNIELRSDGAGSALFIHVHSRDAENRVQATSGGVGLEEGQVRSILKLLDPAKNPVAIMGPTAWISSKEP